MDFRRWLDVLEQALEGMALPQEDAHDRSEGIYVREVQQIGLGDAGNRAKRGATLALTGESGTAPNTRGGSEVPLGCAFISFTQQRPERQAVRDGIEILLLDYEGAAQALSLSRAALRDLVYKGRSARVTKIGRRTFFAVSDLEAFIESCREPVPVTCQEPEQPGKR